MGSGKTGGLDRGESRISQGQRFPVLIGDLGSAGCYVGITSHFAATTSTSLGKLYWCET